MTFWIAAAAILIATTAVLLWPMLRRRSDAPDAASFDVEVYRDQLRQVERDLAEGLVGEREAEAAKAEIGRRLLAADARRTDPEGTSTASKDWSGAVAVGILVPVCALLLYVDAGAPSLPSFPFEERAAQGRDRTPELRAMAEQLTDHLEKEPTDVRGWTLLGRTYTQLGDYRKAAQIYARALILDGGNAELMSARAESLVLADKGVVSTEALEIFRRVLAKQPRNPRALFYLAVADEQDGNMERALSRWKTLIAASPPGAPWAEIARNRGSKAAAALGLDPAKEIPPPPAETARGPTAEDMAAAQNMTPEERKAMIESMVQSLAARLEENPDDLEGWIRLARSYTVLDEKAAARNAMAKAAEIAPENVDILLLYGRAIRTAADNKQTPESVAVMRRVLAIDPKNIEALWLVGMAEAGSDDRADGLAKMQQALDQLPADAPNRTALEERLRELKNAEQ